MLLLSFIRAFAVLVPWLVYLATWLLARSLNMPQPIVHDTGVFVVAQVTAAEIRAGRAVCKQLRSWFC